MLSQAGILMHIRLCMLTRAHSPLAALVAYPMTLLLYCIVSAVNELEVVNCSHRLTFLSSCYLVSQGKKTGWLVLLK